MAIPSIACIAIIGREDNPLHIALFPPYDSRENALLDFSFILNASLDIFDAKTQDANVTEHFLGLLQVIDPRLSLYGWQTGIGARCIVIVDNWGKDGQRELSRQSTTDSLRGGRSSTVRITQPADVVVAFEAIHRAYAELLQNPFYSPDEHRPPNMIHHGDGSGKITSRAFIAKIQRIGDQWKPGLTTL